MRIAREALPFVLPVAALALLMAAIGRWPVALGLALAGATLALFFRIPRRHAPQDPAAVLAPANGRVLRVEPVEDGQLGAGTWHRIVIFLSVFDVHVQRAPIAGQVIETTFRPGRKVAAFRPEAGEVNESRLVVLRGHDGSLVGVRQIAGLLARRTVTYLTRGSLVARGDLIGVIKFGSRVDLLLPGTFLVTARAGQRVLEGETVVARSMP